MRIKARGIDPEEGVAIVHRHVGELRKKGY